MGIRLTTCINILTKGQISSTKAFVQFKSKSYFFLTNFAANFLLKLIFFCYRWINWISSCPEVWAWDVSNSPAKFFCWISDKSIFRNRHRQKVIITKERQTWELDQVKVKLISFRETSQQEMYGTERSGHENTTLREKNGNVTMTVQGLK